MKHTKPTLVKIESLLQEVGFRVRYEKGNFNSGYCILEDKSVIVINKFFDTQGRVQVLLDLIDALPIDETMLSDKSKTVLKALLKMEDI